MTLALILFLSCYALMISFSKYRPYIAAGFAFLFPLLGILPWADVLPSIEWNVILMIAGTMGLVVLFIDSGMPAHLADLIIQASGDLRTATIALSVFAGIVSAFIDNVATVLIVAPIAITIAKKLDISPVPSVIAISIASNLEGAATLVGDTTSILLGGFAHMNFMDFIFYQGKPGLFFINQIGLFFATLTLYRRFRGERQPIRLDSVSSVDDHFPTWLICGMIAALIAASFFPAIPDPWGANINGLICMGFLLAGILVQWIRGKMPGIGRRVLKEIDYPTLLLLASLFVVIAGIKEAGVIDAIAVFFSRFGSGSLFLLYTLIVWLSVFFSAFIDNIPYVATMLPVVQSVALQMQLDPTVLYFGLLCGATLGGNLTPIGASANIASLGMLRREGFSVSNRDFMRISVPYTLAAVTSAWIMVWLLFAPQPFHF